MSHSGLLVDFVLAFNYFVLFYFLTINGIYLSLYLISLYEVVDYARREVFGGFSDLFTSNYAPPVSVIVAAYNEEVTITESVRSLLALHYPIHEVVIVNDGSKDDTLEVLKEEFELYESDQPVRLQLETAPIRGTYVSPSRRLIVVDKENGKRADALNAGLLAASYPFVCCTDADVVMEEDALLRVARPMIESEEVAAVGGIIRIANGCKIEDGRVVAVRASNSPLPGFQVIEYLRAFVASRTAWSKLNCLLIVSGAFGFFRRNDVIKAGGFAHDSLAEDMDMTTRLHRTLKDEGRKYRIEFVPDPVLWTEAPDTIRMLHSQRDRWHRGLIETLIKYRRMMFNPRYGTVGLLAMPYYLFFEFLGPIIELLGYVVFVIGLMLGVVTLKFALLFLLVSVGLGIFLFIAALFMEELRFRRYSRWTDLGKLTLYAVLENFGYRQMNTVWRVMAIGSYLRKDTEWGEMKRTGFGPRKAGADPEKTEKPEGEFDRDPADVWETATRKPDSSQGVLRRRQKIQGSSEPLGEPELWPPSQSACGLLGVHGTAELLTRLRRSILRLALTTGDTRHYFMEFVDARLCPGTNIVSARGEVPRERPGVGSGYVFDVYVVARLFPGTVDLASFARRHTSGEDRHHPGLAPRVLSRTVDVGVA